ncbi:hypothetical protein LTS08_006386 [Lithohypha guttulata]|nr:hypothetical protein LTS08_006386 [Lithohypha guttulata]
MANLVSAWDDMTADLALVPDRTPRLDLADMLGIYFSLYPKKSDMRTPYFQRQWKSTYNAAGYRRQLAIMLTYETEMSRRLSVVASRVRALTASTTEEPAMDAHRSVSIQSSTVRSEQSVRNVVGTRKRKRDTENSDEEVIPAIKKAKALTQDSPQMGGTCTGAPVLQGDTIANPEECQDEPKSMLRACFDDTDIAAIQGLHNRMVVVMATTVELIQKLEEIDRLLDKHLFANCNENNSGRKNLTTDLTRDICSLHARGRYFISHIDTLAHRLLGYLTVHNACLATAIHASDEEIGETPSHDTENELWWEQSEKGAIHYWLWATTLLLDKPEHHVHKV